MVCKEFGKFKIYSLNQTLLDPPEPETLRALDNDLTFLADQEALLRENLKQLQGQVANLEREPSMAVLDQNVLVLRSEVSRLEEKLQKLEEQSKDESTKTETDSNDNMKDNDKENDDKSHDNGLSRIKKAEVEHKQLISRVKELESLCKFRKRVTSEVVSQLAEATCKKPKLLFEEIGLEEV